MSLNNGIGEVILKDKLLLDESIYESISLVKHANGKDWWILAHEFPEENSCTNKFYKLLVKENEISLESVQQIGSQHCNGEPYPGGALNFSRDGNQLSIVSFSKKIVDIFKFSRCTGMISNHQNIVINNFNSGPYGCEFSPSGRFLYLSLSTLNYNQNDAIDYVYQYDLLNSQRHLIWSDSSLLNRDFVIGQLRLAPDNKIYITYTHGGFPISTLNFYNNNLSYINNPDSLGITCDLHPFAFNLGDSAYTSLGLPNIPNYNLGPINIDTCFTTSISAVSTKNKLKLFPNPTNETLYLESSQAFQSIQILSLSGKEMLFTNERAINVSELAIGLYLVKVNFSNGESLVRKVVVE
jgi:hypothetical protein